LFHPEQSDDKYARLRCGGLSLLKDDTDLPFVPADEPSTGNSLSRLENHTLAQPAIHHNPDWL
jgi:hypothetical protein